MAVLPYSRVVDVNLTRNQSFPSIRGFGTQLILTNEKVTNKVDTTYRTKLYASMEEVAEDWSTDKGAYKAALSAFSRSPSPLQIKIGHVAGDLAGEDVMDTDDFTAQLDLIAAYDSDWYMVTISSELRDFTPMEAIFAWAQGKHKVPMIDSNASGHESPSNTSVTAAKHKGLFDQSAVFYHPDATQFLAASAAGYMATRNFDGPDSAYTLKFKNMPGITPVNIGSAAVTAVTGFQPGVGQSKTAGHCANTYIDIGGQNFLVEGSTLTPNVFLDEVHATDWIIARTEEEMLGILLNNDRVSYDDPGMQVLASGVRNIMNRAALAGLIANDVDPVTQKYAPNFVITVPSVFTVSEAQRKARIAPPISCRFRYASAVHYTTVNYKMTF